MTLIYSISYFLKAFSNSSIPGALPISIILGIAMLIIVIGEFYLAKNMNRFLGAVKNTPVGIYLISALLIFFSFISILASITLPALISSVSPPGIEEARQEVIQNYFYIISGISIIISTFLIILGIFLFLGKNWARITLSIISIILLIITVLILIFQGQLNLFSIILNGLIIYYLLFSQKAKEFFN